MVLLTAKVLTQLFTKEKKMGTYKYFYKGSFVNGLKHGKAIHIIKLPTYLIKFQGSFKNDLSDGYGVFNQ
jgi:hypothetical protein